MIKTAAKKSKIKNTLPGEKFFSLHTSIIKSQWNLAIVHRGVQSPTWKNTVPPKDSISTWNNITYVPAKLPDLPKIKFRVHFYLKYIFQKVFKMIGVKLTIDRLSLIGIYWYQSANRFINLQLFMHSHMGGLTIDLTMKPALLEYINKWGNYI